MPSKEESGATGMLSGMGGDEDSRGGDPSERGPVMEGGEVSWNPEALLFFSGTRGSVSGDSCTSSSNPVVVVTTPRGRSSCSRS